MSSSTTATTRNKSNERYKDSKQLAEWLKSSTKCPPSLVEST